VTLTLLVLAGALALGAACGSFLNVCIHRLPRRCMTVHHPRGSVCPRCGHPIRGRDNLPVLSWILLRGRCRDCGTPIRPRYMLVELLTATLFVLATMARLGVPVMPQPWQVFVWLACDCYLVAAVVVLSGVDLELQIIPDEISCTGLPLALAAAALAPTPLLEASLPALSGIAPVDGLLAGLAGAATGAGAVWLIGFLGTLLFRQEAMGLGDVKIMAVLGALLGWDGCLAALLVATLAAGLVSTGIFLVARRHTLAFGPYLAFAALGVRLGDVSLTGLVQRSVAWVGEEPGRHIWVAGGCVALVGYMVVILVLLRRDRRQLAGESAESP